MIRLIFLYLRKLPLAIYYWIGDIYRYYKNRENQQFTKWGIHLYVGEFGAGKTCSMVHYAYSLAMRYKQLNIMTNLRLRRFPKWTKVIPLNHYDDILNAPNNTLVLIDEIGTIFNSRDFMKGNSLPKDLFQKLCQCRKRHVVVWGTTQRWNFCDKQIRDIVATVYTNHTHLAHPFSRICTVRRYKADEYDLKMTNPLYPIDPIGVDVYVQTDKLRTLYSTDEVIENMLNTKAEDWLSDKEIEARRGNVTTNLQDFSVPHRKALRKQPKRSI